MPDKNDLIYWKLLYSGTAGIGVGAVFALFILLVLAVLKLAPEWIGAFLAAHPDLVGELLAWRWDIIALCFLTWMIGSWFAYKAWFSELGED